MEHKADPVDALDYAGTDQYVPAEVLKRRTVRDQEQALVRWKPGYTAHKPGSPFWAEVQAVIQTRRNGQTLVRWRDSWQLAADVDEALAAASAGRVLYASAAGVPASEQAAATVGRPVARAARASVESAVAPTPAAVPAPARGAGSAKSGPPSTPPRRASTGQRAAPKVPRKRKRKAAPAQAPPPSEYLALTALEYAPPPGLSSGSDEEGEDAADVPGPSRRRVAHPETWKRNLKKPRLEPPLVSEKPPCACALRCYQRIGREKRKVVRSTFQELERPQQKAYM
jgi:hypothetical protein